MDTQHRDSSQPPATYSPLDRQASASRIPKPQLSSKLTSDACLGSTSPSLSPVCKHHATTPSHARAQQSTLVDLLLESSFKGILATPDREDHNWLLGTSADVEVEVLAAELPLSAGRVAAGSDPHRPSLSCCQLAVKTPHSTAGGTIEEPPAVAATPLSNGTGSERDFSPVVRLQRLWHWVWSTSEHQQQPPDSASKSSARSLSLAFSSAPSTTGVQSLPSPDCRSQSTESPSPVLCRPRARGTHKSRYASGAAAGDGHDDDLYLSTSSIEGAPVPALPLWRIKGLGSKSNVGVDSPAAASVGTGNTSSTTPMSGSILTSNSGGGCGGSSRQGDYTSNDDSDDMASYYTACSSPRSDWASETKQPDRYQDHDGGDGVGHLDSVRLAGRNEGEAEVGSARLSTHRSDLPSGRSACMEYSLFGTLHDDVEVCDWLVASDADAGIKVRIWLYNI